MQVSEPLTTSWLLIVLGILLGASALLSRTSQRVRVPVVVVFREHFPTVVQGVLACLATYVVFYLTTVFAMSWGTTTLGYTRESFLMLQLVESKLELSRVICEGFLHRFIWLAALAYWGIGMPVGAGLGLALGWGPKGMWLGLTAGLSVAAFLLCRRFLRSSLRVPIVQEARVEGGHRSP